jgi:carbon-monoxide dehydrogenase large subunit
MTYDTGNYPELLRKVLEKADYESMKRSGTGFESKDPARLIGIGISCIVEETGAGPFEGARIRAEPDGRVVISTGACSQGQGHETIFSQVAADALGVSPEDVTIIGGDTRHISYGIGTLASRSSVTASSAIVLAAETLKQKAISLAAEFFEVGAEDLEMREGRVFVKGAPDRSVSLGELATFSLGVSPGIILPPGMKPGLEAEEYFAPEKAAYSAGAHVAVVEVDPQTGFVKILRYVAGHDCGKQINPLLVDGQIRGGVVHGLGDVLIEEVAYDENGQPLASTFLDYLLPLASDAPAIETVHQETPCPYNLVGVKGAGESGTIGAVAAIVSAIEDALKPFGVQVRESPLGPARLHALIQDRANQSVE